VGFRRKSAPSSHWIFRTDKPLDTAQESYTDLSGAVLVELRGTGGMTVHPPSVHMESGERIFWERFTEPAQVNLGELQKTVRVVAAIALLARNWPAKGIRQDSFMALSGGLLRAGWEERRVEGFVEALAAATQDEETPKRVQTVRQTAAKLAEGKKTTGWQRLEEILGSSGRDVVNHVRAWLGFMEQSPWSDPVPLGAAPSVVPFPLEVFPEQLRRVVLEGAAALPCPPDYLAVPLLVMAGGAIGSSRALAIKRSHIQRAIIYAAVIGPPGSAKSPALEIVVEPAHETEERLHAAWKGKMEQYQVQMEEFEKELKEWRKNGGTYPEKPERPILERLTVNDATAEALVPILNENARGVVLVRDELIGWVQAMNQYREGAKGADQQFGFRPGQAAPW
jgi:hypothetical protein